MSQITIPKNWLIDAPFSWAVLNNNIDYLLCSRKWIEDYSLGKKGLNEDNIIGLNHYDIFPAILDMPEWLDEHQRCIGGETISKEKEKFVRENGRVHYLNYIICPWYMEDGQVGGPIFYSHDVTKYVLLNQELDEAYHLHSVMAYIVSHFFNWPISSQEGLNSIISDNTKRIKGSLSQTIENLEGAKNMVTVVVNSMSQALAEGDCGSEEDTLSIKELLGPLNSSLLLINQALDTLKDSRNLQKMNEGQLKKQKQVLELINIMLGYASLNLSSWSKEDLLKVGIDHDKIKPGVDYDNLIDKLSVLGVDVKKLLTFLTHFKSKGRVGAINATEEELRDE